MVAFLPATQIVKDNKVVLFAAKYAAKTGVSAAPKHGVMRLDPCCAPRYTSFNDQVIQT